ncbi:hypothetical protein BDV97DRAFT_124097 [Delphinella strobiligena]|nr:hypothetical protein BDV97DRAFT_124097 [Delphinella strobiligena]
MLMQPRQAQRGASHPCSARIRRAMALDALPHSSLTVQHISAQHEPVNDCAMMIQSATVLNTDGNLTSHRATTPIRHHLDRTRSRGLRRSTSPSAVAHKPFLGLGVSQLRACHLRHGSSFHSRLSIAGLCWSLGGSTSISRLYSFLRALSCTLFSSAQQDTNNNFLKIENHPAA